MREKSAFTTTQDALSVSLSAVQAGNVLIMIGGDPENALVSVSGGGATWVPAAGSFTNTNVELWYGVTDGTNPTVTISLPGTSQQMWMVVSEWEGLDTANLVDASANASGTNSTVSAGAINITSSLDLVLFATTTHEPNDFVMPTPGAWTAMTGITVGTVEQLAWYQVVAAGGTLSPAVEHTGGSWDAVAVALRIAP